MLASISGESSGPFATEDLVIADEIYDFKYDERWSKKTF